MYILRKFFFSVRKTHSKHIVLFPQTKNFLFLSIFLLQAKNLGFFLFFIQAKKGGAFAPPQELGLK